MIKYITVTNALNDRLTIDMRNPDKSIGFLIQSITGLDPVKATINLSNYASLDGGSFNSARLPYRNIVISLRYLNCNLSMEEIRHNSYKYFPVKKKVEIEIVTDKRKGTISGYVEKNEVNIFSKSEGSVISIMCPNPYFYSTKNTTIFYGIENDFEFPFSNESTSESLITMGSIVNHQQANIVYKGDADTGLIFNFYAKAAVSNISVYNLSTREEMHINVNLLEEDELIVSTVKGDKYVKILRLGKYYNHLGDLDIDNSTWFQITKGDNEFAYTSDEGIDNLQLKILNSTLYEGM